MIADKQIEVKVGSGLTDDDRLLSADEFVNKTIELEYNDIIKSENSDHYSLFLPRFKRIKM